MKIKFIICFLLTGFFLSSCQEDDSSSGYPIEAEVLGPNLDCNIYEIKITKGLSKVVDIAGPSINDNIYIAKNLADGLQLEGLLIQLDARAVKKEEITACTTLGLTYPMVFVMQARKK